MSQNAKKYDYEAEPFECPEPKRSVPVEGQPASEKALGIEATISPAKTLQDRLDAHFAPVSRKMSSRFVTLLVMFTCLGTWIGGVGLYATL